MSRIQKSLPSNFLRFWTVLTIALLAHPTMAIVIRDDREEARYVALGDRLPAAVSVLPDGSGASVAADWVLTAGHVSPVELYSGDDEVGQMVTFVGRGGTGTGLTGPQVADGRKRGATNRVESADEATELEGYTRVSTHREWIESIVSGRSVDGEVDMGASSTSESAPGAGSGGGTLVDLPTAGGDSPRQTRRISGMSVAAGDSRAGAVEPQGSHHGIEGLDWIVGNWRRESRRGVVYESWKRLSDRTFEGDSWIVSNTDGERYPLESLLLVEMAGELFYIPKVAENEYPVPFRRVSMEPGRVVFENPTHDFPQRITYQRSRDDGLRVTIEGPVEGEESRQVDFLFRRVE